MLFFMLITGKNISMSTSSSNSDKKPKRPQTAYMFFCKAVRPSLKSEFPNVSQSEILKLFGERWKALSEEDKIPYVEDAQKDKERYLSQLPKEPFTPKKNVSAYIHFDSANRKSIKEENPGLPFTEISKLIGSKWKALSDVEKAVYKEKAQLDKERYEKEMAQIPDFAQPKPEGKKKKKSVPRDADSKDSGSPTPLEAKAEPKKPKANRKPKKDSKKSGTEEEEKLLL